METPSRLRRARNVGAMCAIFAGSFLIGRGVALGPTLDDLAMALADATGGTVEPRDVRWEPSAGAVSDFVLGRWALFLASETRGGPRDVWRARVRLTPEGRPIAVTDAHDLTGTPLGDDHALVVDGDHAAFATFAFGQEQSVTLLDLGGEGAQNKTTAFADRAMAWITNDQQTGAGAGVGRVDVTLDAPARAVGLALSDDTLAVDLADDDGRMRHARLAIASGELQGDGMHAEPARHLPKRLVFWAVDTLRAVPWIGPAPIAWLEDRVFAARDAVRQIAFKLHGADDADTLARPADSPKPVAAALDATQAVDLTAWPPAALPSLWKSPEPGEGQWSAARQSWIRKLPTADATTPPAFFRTFVRPDPERPYSHVLLVAMDTRQLDLQMEAGLEDPKPLTGPHGVGRLPRDPKVLPRVAAAFNGAFKTEHGNYGMMVNKRVLLPPQPSAASVVVLSDGRAALGTWPASTNVGGLGAIPDDAILSFRQNLDALIDGDQINPTKRSLWGFTLPGTSAQTERSGLCVTPSGHLVYAWGDDVNATALGKAMIVAGCTYGMHLDMNPHHTGFTFTAIDDVKARKFKVDLLSTDMTISPDRYVEYAPKDFFYMVVRDPAPPPVGSAAWAIDAGTQPAPAWLPAVWSAKAGPVELFDVEAGRVTWRLRAGTREPDAKTGAQPTYALTGDEAHRALLSVGLGASAEKRPAGLATDGKMVLPMGGLPHAAALVVGADGALAIARSEEVATVGAHVDAAEVPLVLDQGAVLATPNGPIEQRAALGVTAQGRVLVARGSFASDGPLAEALKAAGCVRAVALRRGPHAAAELRRAGTASPPRATDEETTLYAIAAPMKPRAFKFEAGEAVAKAGK